jgi:hypothetical protein
LLDEIPGEALAAGTWRLQHRSQRRTDLASFLIDEIGRDDPFTLLKRQDIQSAAAISGSDTYETVAAAAPVNNQSGIGLPRRRPTTEPSVLMASSRKYSAARYD